MCDGSQIIIMSGKRLRISKIMCHMGGLRYLLCPKYENPRWIRPMFSIFTPSFTRRFTAPAQRPMSGVMGFLMSTVMSSLPWRLSAISCTAKGDTVVRAPIHSMSTPCLSAHSTCAWFATSTAIGSPVALFTSLSHSRPGSPIPSNVPGLVRGFHTPARITSTLPERASCMAVSTVCSRVSALHGPAMMRGLLAPRMNFPIVLFLGNYIFQCIPSSATAKSNPTVVRPRPRAAFADLTLPYIPSLGGDFQSLRSEQGILIYITEFVVISVFP